MSLREQIFASASLLPVAGLAGILGTYRLGGYVHVLLVVALVLFAIERLSNRRRFVLEPSILRRSVPASHLDRRRD